MVWILVWLQLSTGQKLDYYHVGTYENKEACFEELKKAVVLVNKNAAVDCMPINIDDI
jgi:hypothetical protein